MGGAQLVTLATALIRSKMIAAIFGPGGIGLMGVFNAFNSNVVNIAGWGVGTSVVRTVAGSADADRGRKVAAAQKFGLSLAVIGAFLLLASFLPVGQLTFSSQKYALELFIAGLAVPCMIATSMWSALLQAGGRVRTMASTQAKASIIGLIAGVPFIYLYGSIGIAASILLVAMVTAYMTWRAASRHGPVALDRHEQSDITELIRLGIALQIGNVVSALAVYLIRVLILRSHGNDLQAGLADAGFFQAAFVVASTLPGVIFSANSSDFYPRIAAAKDEAEARLITEKQIQASLLLAMPILMGLMTMGPLAIRLLYAKGFEPAVPMLEWFVWGSFCNLLGWPLGFWVVARRSKRMVALFQSLIGVGMFILAFALIPHGGALGASIAHFGAGLLHVGTLLCLIRYFSGGWLSHQTVVSYAACFMALLLGKFAMSIAPSAYWGVAPTLIVGGVSAYAYFRVASHDQPDA